MNYDKSIETAVIGVGAAALFGFAAVKYIDSMNEEKNAIEHFKETKRPAQKKNAVPLKKPTQMKKAAPKKAAPTKVEKFGNVKAIKNKEFLTNTTRFGASTRDILNYRDIRPMPVIAPPDANAIPFGNSGVSDVPTNMYGKNIFSVGSGSGASAVTSGEEANSFASENSGISYAEIASMPTATAAPSVAASAGTAVPGYDSGAFDQAATV